MVLANDITRFGLIRHAQTRWNREKRIQGQSDSPVTADGKRQATRWGHVLKQFAWDRIIASDTGRARETAELINVCLNISLTTDSRLREQDWGHWAGKTIEQLKTEIPNVLDAQASAGWAFCPPGGEDRQTVLERSHKALLEAAARWPGTNILVVTHEGVVKSLIYHLCGRKFLATEPPLLKPYQLHRLVHDRDGFKVEELNAIAMDSFIR
jgi:probable phosphoglycerate mutase